jgi:hypothetical protein
MRVSFYKGGSVFDAVIDTTGVSHRYPGNIKSSNYCRVANIPRLCFFELNFWQAMWQNVSPSISATSGLELSYIHKYRVQSTDPFFSILTKLPDIYKFPILRQHCRYFCENTK